MLDIFKPGEAKALQEQTGMTENQIAMIVGTVVKEVSKVMEQQQEIAQDTNETMKKHSKQLEDTQRDMKKGLEEVRDELFGRKETRAMKLAAHKKAIEIVERKGVQLSFDDLIKNTNADAYERTKAIEQEDRMYKYQVGRAKQKIRYHVLSRMGYKKTTPYGEIKKIDLNDILNCISNIRENQIDLG